MNGNGHVFGAGGGQRSMRLDADLSAFYSQALQYVAAQAFDVKRQPLLSRQLIPTIQGIPEWAETFKFRGHELVGSAGLGSDKANAPRRANVIARESTPVSIVTRWSSFSYSEEEILAARAQSIPLSSLYMQAALRAVEQMIDSDLALGDASVGILGLLNQTGTTTETASTKAAGGTSWTGASADEIALDVFNLIDKIADDTHDDQAKYRIVLPRTKLQRMRKVRMGDGQGGDTVYKHVLETHEQIESIRPWSRCLTAGTNSATRMCAFPVDAGVVGAVVPREPRLGAPVVGLMETEQAITARCGGVVAFYPLQIGYMDAI